jgi:type II secretory pathway component PulL
MPKRKVGRVRKQREQRYTRAQNIADLFLVAGEKPEAICRHLGISRQTMMDWLRVAGFTIVRQVIIDLEPRNGRNEWERILGHRPRKAS